MATQSGQTLGGTAAALARLRKKASTLIVPRGSVGLICENPPLRLVVPLGEEPPVLADGLGGWDVTERPQQVSMTTWKGNNPYTLTLNVMFDGYADNEHVEHSIALLRVAARGDDSQPGVFLVKGVPNLGGVDDWVITGIEEGDVIRRPEDMRRVRQALTITLLEYNPPDWESVKKTALQGAKSRTHLVTVKHSPSKHDPKNRGETPAQLAKRLRVKIADLRRLNPKTVHLANRPLTVGQKIRAPLPNPSSRKKSTHKKR